MRMAYPMLKGVVTLLTLALLSCGSGGEVKIGVIIPSEGSLGDYGFQIISGIELAEKEIQSETDPDKKLTKKYTVYYENESADPSKVDVAIDSFNRLKKKGVTAIIGAASSAATLALTPLANESKIILLSPASSSPEINKEGDFVYRNYPSDTLEAQYLSNVIFSKCRMSRVLMVRSKNAYAEGITYELLGFARKVSFELPNKVVKFEGDPAQVDFAAVVNEIVEIKPQAVFLGAYSDSLIPLIKEIKQMYIFTSSSFLPSKVAKALGPETVENVLFTTYSWGVANEEKRQEFIKNFEATYHFPPNIYAAAGYDALKLLCTKLDGINHHIPGDVRLEMNREAYQGVLGETSFNKRGDVTRIPELFWMKGGVAVKTTDEDLEEIKKDILLNQSDSE